MTSRKDPPTIGQSFDGRSNALNVMRLGLAMTVILAHAWQLGGWSPRPNLGDLELGSTAVGAFFAISGFLITQSAQRLPISAFLLHRILRLYPGFLCALVVTAVVFAPLSVIVFDEARWDRTAALRFVVTNLGLKLVTVDIAGTLDRVPFPANWNGVMWTLAYEFCCYLGAGALAALRRRYRIAAATVALVVLFAVELVARLGLAHVPHGIRIGLWPAACFVAGSLLYLRRNQIPNSATLGVVAVAAVALGTFTGLGSLVAPLPFAYLLILAATRLPGRRIGSTNDISYGLYLYGWPVGQLLAHVLRAPDAHPLAIFSATVVLTVPFAWLSWVCVERPAREWGQRLIATRGAGVPRSTS